MYSWESLNCLPCTCARSDQLCLSQILLNENWKVWRHNNDYNNRSIKNVWITMVALIFIFKSNIVACDLSTSSARRTTDEKKRLNIIYWKNFSAKFVKILNFFKILSVRWFWLWNEYECVSWFKIMKMNSSITIKKQQN